MSVLSPFMLGVWNKGHTGTFKVRKSFYSPPHPFSLVPRPFSIFRMGSGNEASIHWYWWQQIWISVKCAQFLVWLTSIPLVACMRAEELVSQNIFPEWFWLPFKEGTLVKMYFYPMRVRGHNRMYDAPSKGQPENPLLCFSDSLYVAVAPDERFTRLRHCMYICCLSFHVHCTVAHQVGGNCPT